MPSPPNIAARENPPYADVGGAAQFSAPGHLFSGGAPGLDVVAIRRSQTLFIQCKVGNRRDRKVARLIEFSNQCVVIPIWASSVDLTHSYYRAKYGGMLNLLRCRSNKRGGIETYTSSIGTCLGNTCLIDEGEPGLLQVGG
jgi:hypothetical protein